MYTSSCSDGATIAPLSNQDWLMLEELFHDANQETIEQIEAISLTIIKPSDNATSNATSSTLNPSQEKRRKA